MGVVHVVVLDRLSRAMTKKRSSAFLRKKCTPDKILATPMIRSCGIEDERLVKTVMLGMVEGDRPRGRPQEDGLTILQTGADVQSQRR